MTKEEAIICLKGIKKYGRDTFTEQSDWQNSIDMAIKALEQQPSDDKAIKTRYELIKDMSIEEMARFISGIRSGDVGIALQYACNAQFLNECFECAKKKPKENCYRKWLENKSYMSNLTF